MKTKFQSGKIKLLIKSYPIPSVDIFNGKDFWFSTTNPSVLLDISKVIAEFSKALNEERKKQTKILSL